MLIRPAHFPELPSEWETVEHQMPSADHQEKLWITEWRKKKLTRSENETPTLIVLHGMGEHGYRYLHLPYYLESVVDRVVVMDHRGHGRSTGIRGHISNFDEYVEDANALIKKFHGREVHLLGHSMGGLIALRLTEENPRLNIRSVTLTSPLLGIKVPLPLVKRMGAQILSRTWGKLLMKNEIKPNLLSHDPEVVNAYKQDRLVHSFGTPSLYTSLLGAFKSVEQDTKEYLYPLQLLIALEDQIVDSSKSVWFFEGLQAKDKRMVTYSKFYHEILNESEKEKPLKEIELWIKKHSRR